jgi:hypothetical protein
MRILRTRQSFWTPAGHNDSVVVVVVVVIVVVRRTGTSVSVVGSRDFSYITLGVVERLPVWETPVWLVTQ